MQFTLNIPAGEVAVGDEDMASLFPHTPRLDDRCFEQSVSADLVTECLRAGTCAAQGADREWMGGILHRLGHAANDRGETLMAHSWFQCAYAAKGTTIELLSSTNMRLKLGQWDLCEKLYSHVKTLELTDAESEVAERKHKEVNALLGGGGSSRARPPRIGAAEESDALLAAPAAHKGALSSDDTTRMLSLMRRCGHAANGAGDFAAAHVWFDCAFALSGSANDLLSAANMRVKLLPTSSVGGSDLQAHSGHPNGGAERAESQEFVDGQRKARQVGNSSRVAAGRVCGHTTARWRRP